MTLPPIGSVWTDNDNDPSFAYTILVLGNSIDHYGASTRVLLVYSNGNISDQLWSTSAFDSAHAQDEYKLLYSPEERGES
jgi:hypothetical protein